jgi:hypothetical protein
MAIWTYHLPYECRSQLATILADAGIECDVESVSGPFETSIVSCRKGEAKAVLRISKMFRTTETGQRIATVAIRAPGSRQHQRHFWRYRQENRKRYKLLVEIKQALKHHSPLGAIGG